MSLDINNTETSTTEETKKTVRYYETGHAKNVNNFDTMLTYVNTLGEAYKPIKDIYKIPAMEALTAEAKLKLNEVNVNLIQYTDKVSIREQLFAPLKRTVYQAYAALKVNEDSEAVLEDAMHYVRLLKGQRATKVKDESRTISVSQMSYDSRVSNFDKFILFLESNTTYAPNEENLQTTALRAYYNELVTANNEVRNIYTLLTQSRMERDIVLYQPKTGLVEVSKGVKIYLDSILATSHPIYAKIKKIRFTSKK